MPLAVQAVQCYLCDVDGVMRIRQSDFPVLNTDIKSFIMRKGRISFRCHDAYSPESSLVVSQALRYRLMYSALSW